MRLRRRRNWRVLVAAGLAVAAVVAFNARAALPNLVIRRAMQRHDLVSAEAWLKAAQTWRLANGETALLGARLARRRGRHAEMNALLHLAASRGIQPDLVQRERRYAAIQEGHIDAQVANRLVQSGGDDAIEVFYVLASGHIKLGDVITAARILEAWVDHAPRDVKARLLRARLLVTASDYENALSDLEVAHRLSPGNEEILLELGQLLLTRQRADEALVKFETVSSDGPHQLAARLGAAKCLVRLGRAEEARQRLRSLVAVEGAPEDVHLALGQVELSLRDYRAAAASLAVFEDSSHIEGLHLLATAKRELGSVQPARKLFARGQRIATKLREARALEELYYNELPDANPDISSQRRRAIAALYDECGRRTSAEFWSSDPRVNGVPSR